MRKRLMAVLLAALTFIGSSMPVSAAQKKMGDGGIFDPQYYAANNPDVVSVFGTDENALYKHYLEYGKKEGRLPYDPSQGTAQSSAAQNYGGIRTTS